MSLKHPAEDLWDRHHPSAPYPEGVERVPEPIPGRAFFPGGYGLWGCREGQPLPEFPIGGVMVLGHDFHSREGYDRSLSLGGEPKTMPTWRNLIGLFEEAGITPQRCFFTNFYMGLRSGAATTGPFPGATNPGFVEHCRQFFLEQVRAQRPALIVTLGVYVPRMIGYLSPELHRWAQGTGLKHLDDVGAVQPDVTFHDITNYSTTAVALIHPSLRHASLRHRKYDGLESAAAELAMLRDGIALSRAAAGQRTLE